jgi:cytochrome c oxidase subunit III
MSVTTETMPPMTERESVVYPVDDQRGTAAMVLFIATETFLFTLLFFSYFYLSRGDVRWLHEEPPKLPLAFVLLAILLVSSGVIFWGERQIKMGNSFKTKLSIIATIILGLIFLGLQTFEYRDHLKTLTPRTDVYGSIFYTITSFHAAHVIVGLLILAYVLLLPRLEPTTAPPHRPFHNAAIYWHFVDIVWIFVVALLYVLPNLR